MLAVDDKVDSKEGKWKGKVGDFRDCFFEEELAEKGDKEWPGVENNDGVTDGGECEATKIEKKASGIDQRSKVKVRIFFEEGGESSGTDE